MKHPIEFKTDEKSLETIYESFSKERENQPQNIQNLISNIINYYETILRCMPGNVYWMDKNAHTVGCNQNVLDTFNLRSLSEFRGLSFKDMAKLGKWSENQGDSFKNDTLEVLSTGQAKMNIDEPPILGPTGSETYFLTSRVPLFNNNNEVIGIVGISTDISEKKIAEKELLAAKEKAEAANEAKSNFLAVMSHELRTPLNGILGLTQVLSKQKNLAGNSHEYINDIENAAKHLLNLVNDILDFSKLEINANIIIEETIDIESIFQEVFSTCKERAKVRKLKMTLHYDKKIPKFILGDSLRLKQVMLNLIDNAIKYTVKGDIQINLTRQKNFLHFSVKDTGIGIPENMKDLVFEKFVQVESGYVRNSNGLGLGLAICKKLVHQMGGSIGLDSEPDKGSTFWFTLPCIVSVTDKKAIEQEEDFILQPGFTAEILVVEDNRLNQKVAKLLLEELGCVVTIAATGSEALKAVEEKSFDLIFMDLGLPDTDGYAVTRKIRKQFKMLPIVGLTAHANNEDIKKCFSVKMNDVLTKPVALNDFCRVLTQLIQK